MGTSTTQGTVESERSQDKWSYAIMCTILAWITIIQCHVSCIEAIAMIQTSDDSFHRGCRIVATEHCKVFYVRNALALCVGLLPTSVDIDIEC